MVSTVSSRHFTVVLLGLFAAWPALAGDWKFQPKVTVAEVYTDNVKLASEDKESSFITELTPGFTLSSKGGRGEVFLDYSLQGLIYSYDSSANDLHNHLSAKMHTELIDGRFFLDADARVGQGNSNSINGPAARGNYNDTGNRVETRTFSLTPSWHSHFGSTADFDARLKFSYSGSDRSDTLDSNVGTALNLALASGSAFHRTPWNVTYRLQDSNGSSDTQYSSVAGNIGYLPTSKLRLYMTAGWDDNNRGSTGSFNDRSGVHWKIGANWAPSTRTQVDINAGHRYNGNSYGLNLVQRTRKTNWALRYSEDIVDVYSQLNTYDVYLCPTSLVLVPEGTPSPSGECVLVIAGLSTPFAYPINDVSLNKSWSGLASWRLGRSMLSASLHRTKRELLETGITDTTDSVRGVWRMQLNPLTSSSVVLTRSRSDSGFSDANIWSAGWTLSRRLSRDTTASMELRHYEGKSSVSTVGTYAENSAIARLNMNF